MTLRIHHRPDNPVALILSYHCAVGAAPNARAARALTAVRAARVAAGDYAVIADIAFDAARAAIADTLAGTSIASVEVSPAPVDDSPATIAAARKLAGAAVDAPLALVGFSHGCQAVRSLLSERPAAVVTIDGTHSSWPPAAGHVEMWRHLAAEARRGARLWVATCTRMTYVESGPQPYASTVSVLEAATGLALRAPEIVRVVDGSLVVESHPSATMDAPAHVRQVREVLPRLVREHLVPYLAGLAPPPPTLRPWELPDLALGLRCCAWLGHQFGLGVREIPGPRHDPRIVAYSQHCRRGGRLVGVDAHAIPMWDGGAPLALLDDETPWCAALASETLRVCLRPGEVEVPPHGLRVSVRELVEDARAAGTLRQATWEPTPGALAILARTGQDPLLGGQGHTRCMLQLDGERYLGLGGNEDNTISVGWHLRADSLLRAWIER